MVAIQKRKYNLPRPIFVLCIVASLLVPATASADCVVLIHGLARTSGSMKPLVKPLQKAGFEVVNVNYPSRHKTVEELAPLAVRELGYKQCSPTANVHFVTHSLGGILVRYFLEHNDFLSLGRVVMIAPPNQGSQVVDKLRDVPGFYLINGPAGMQLGTDKQSIPRQLGAVDFTLGVIAGTRTLNPLLSQLLPNPDDGKVSVENTRVEGMADFIQLPYTHTFIMQADEVIDQVIYFIGHAVFEASN
ncbi:hypothetical protein AB833_10295 [Chromatiales bacterium (ex Bugula neritina AB1)]|nr:hypothetical protein AB833_10295 [Chromatiales bacterium (ex Bugula neritina AB1)]